VKSIIKRTLGAAILCLLCSAGRELRAQERFDNGSFLAMTDSAARLGASDFMSFIRGNAASITLGNLDSLTNRPFSDSLPNEQDLLLAKLIAGELGRTDMAALVHERYATYYILHGKQDTSILERAALFRKASDSMVMAALFRLADGDTSLPLSVLYQLAWLNTRLGNCELSRSALETADALLSGGRIPDSCAFLLEMGALSSSCGIFDAADEYLRRALAGASAPADGKDSMLLAAIYEELGNVAAQTHNWRAHTYYSKAQSIYIRTGDRAGEFRIWDAFVQRARSTGAAEEARDLLALQAAIAHSMNNNDMLFATLSGLCRLEIDAGRHSAADSICASMGALIEAEDLRQLDLAQLQAQIAFGREDFAQARERLLWVLRHSDAKYADAGLAQIMSLLALTEERLGNPDNALGFHKEAVRILESSRKGVYSASDKLNFFAWNLNIYEQAAGFYLRSGRIEDLFSAVESMRSRVFLEDLKAKQGRTASRTEAASPIARYRDLISRTYLEIETTDENEWAKLDLLQKKVHAYSDTLERLEKNVTAGGFEPPAFREAARTLARPGQAAFSYFHVDSSVYAFVLTSRGARLHDLGTDTAELNRLCDDFLRVVSPAGNPPALVLPTEPDPLYEVCVLPLRQYLSEEDTVLIIVPDGRLRSLPFEALLTAYTPGNEARSRRRYLMDDFRIHYYPSLSALAALRDIKAKAKRGSAYLGMGDAVYDFENFAAGEPEKGARLDGEVFRYMEAARIDSIKLDRIDPGGRENTVPAEMFREKGVRADVLLRQEAVSAYLRQADLRDAGYLHLAVHGALGRLVQCLIFSRLPGQPDHGVITSDQLRDIDLNARLAVFSACYSADGFAIPGEGVDGLVGAAFIAGADAVIASLWKASDRTSRELMIALFREIVRSSAEPGEALRTAKRAMLRDPDIDPRFLHPFYWSAYVIYGE